MPKLTTDSVELLYNFKSFITPFSSLGINAKSLSEVWNYLDKFIQKFDSYNQQKVNLLGNEENILVYTKQKLS